MASALIAINVLAVILSAVLIFLLIFLLGYSLKYMKLLLYKIGLIMKAAKLREENPDVVYHEDDSKGDEQGPSVEEVQEILDKMIMNGRSTNFCKIHCFILDRYDSLVVFPCNC